MGQALLWALGTHQVNQTNTFTFRRRCPEKVVSWEKAQKKKMGWGGLLN